MFVTVMLIPLVQAGIQYEPKYSCVNGYLETNITAIVDGEYTEIYYSNVSCSPYDCAYNGIECDSPDNVDKVGVTINSGIFMIAAIIMLLMSYYTRAEDKYWLSMKYLYLAVGFLLMINSAGLVSGIFEFGPNSFTTLSWNSYLLILMTFLISFFIFFLKEMQEYFKKLKIKKGYLK